MEKVRDAPQEVQHFSREQRLYDDTTTWLAEVLEGHMRTPFEYRFDGRELYGRDGGALKPIFDDAIEQAKTFGTHLGFELRRRCKDKQEYQEMISMAKGDRPNTMIVVSDFPPELTHATTDVGGYNANRKQTMLRVITLSEDGRILMRSQSLDKSDRTGLEAIYRSLGFEPQAGELLGQRMHIDLPKDQQEFLVDSLMGVYDRTLQSKYGGNWYAGIQNNSMRNTYDFVRQQNDLLTAFTNKTLMNGGINEDHLYDLAAAMKSRFEQRSLVTNPGDQFTSVNPGINVHAEMQLAGVLARSEGKTFSGCGVSIKANNELSPSFTPDDLAESGYGNKVDDKENWTWKNGICRVDDCPTRPGKTKVGPCDVCTCCQKLFDNGKDPSAEYKKRRAKAKYN